MKNVVCSRCKKRPAVIFISKIIDGKTIPEGLCINCAMEMNIGPIKQMMDQMGITDDDIESISEQFGSAFPDNDEDDDFEAGGSPTMPFLQGLFGSPTGSEMIPKSEDEIVENNEPDKKEPVKKSAPFPPFGARTNKKAAEKQQKSKKLKNLNLYCTNLTNKALEGKIDNVIGREKEIDRTVQILCRRSKNNPCLIGEPGVGKTAIAEGLALKITKGEVPAKLANKQIHLLDLTALVAGTQFRGQFETRIKSLISEVKEHGNIILFIDEVHNLVGAGNSEGSMSVANILKPALSRGEIQVIGATTFKEYRQNIEKDSALERRFQPVKVEEPSIQDAITILKGIKQYYETFHKVQISDYLVEQTVILSERYINDRFLPDKAIDILDEACTCANLRNKAISDFEISTTKLETLKAKEEELLSEIESTDYEAVANVKSEIIKCENSMQGLEEKAKDNHVTAEDLAKVIELWTGIPASKIIESDMKRLADLESILKGKIIGQDEAIHSISAAIKRSRIQISPRRRPSSFIFVGPTGVGKTELVKQIANELFDSPETLIRLDMTEYMEKHSVAKLIGSPPGYVGYDEAGQFTEKVRRKPYSVILLDEIEKAHPDIMNILLQILDEGRITDAQGRTVNFENTIMVMTSNAGSERKTESIGFGKDKKDLTKEKTMKALSEFLRPEFLGRVDDIAIFNALSADDYEKISDIMLQELEISLAEKNITFKWTDAVLTYLSKKAEKGTRGARELRNIIRKEIEDGVANIIIDAMGAQVDAIAVEVDGEELKLSSL